GGEEDADTPFIINPRRAGLQMQAFRALISCKAKLFITSASGIIRRFPNIKTMKKQWVKLVKGSNHDLIGLVETLISFGYNRESMVEKPGEISLRGGILDIFPYTGEEPHRIEFFSDQIDSIRTFDIATQRSTESRDSIQLIPAPVAWDDRSSSLFSYFQDDLIVFLEDRELILAEAEKYCKRNAENSYTTDELKQLFDEHNTISYFSFAGPKDSINFGGKELRSIGRSTLEIRENLASLGNTHKDVFVLCDRKDQKDRIFDFLGLDENPIPGLSLDVVPLQKGFLLSESGLAVYTVGDLFGRYIRKSTRRFHQGVPIRELSSLTRGDFVVHIDYGIGNYQGLEKIFINGTERECLSLLNRDGDKLYVPIGKMERIHRYAGKGGAEPCLSRLGGDAWEKVKARTKRSIKNIARELVSIYSARQADPGFSFSVDASWQKELEATFIYEETPDQAKAISDVKMDMEQSRPMDRLVCGDVGYGKTEVAVRAAFKAVNDGKQVAVLVPTTILAQQHFRTFQDRLSRYPVNLEVLSRFRSRKEQKE
ncbi:DEAD/DEAH box helicase, partial [bacterium]|nr:DEAD/DEAH box helicase [bacterium]